MRRRQLAVIGNGMATSRLLDELVKRAPMSYEVNVFGEEPHGGYNRILLGRVLAGGAPEEIVLKPQEWYADRGIHYHPGVKITDLDPTKRQLQGSDGTTHAYDVAVFATGSAPYIPDVLGLRTAAGATKAGVFAYRTIEDSQRMRAAAGPGANAVVVGGGLLGLEAAKTLCDLGMHVTVLHRAATLMNTQVDAAGGKILEATMQQLGVWVRTNNSPAEVVGDEQVVGVRLASGEVLPADLVVFACGIRPRVDLAQRANVPVRQGILVNDVLATAVPGVYAVGECAEHAGKIYGLVQPIYEQCVVLADLLSAANPKARYRGSKLYTRLKVAGVELASMGVVDAEQEGDEVLEIREERRGIYRKLIVRGNRLVGALLIGDTSSAASLVRLFDRGDPLPENRLDLLSSGIALPGASDPEICNCHHVTAATILGEISQGCDSLAKLAASTKAGTGCGSCRGQLADLILKNAPAAAGSRKG